MMNCTHVKNLLDDYVDGYIMLPQQHAIARHLASCTACRKLVEQQTRLGQMLKSLPVPEPDSRFEGRILDHIEHVDAENRRGNRQQQRGFSGLSTRFGLGGAAVALLVIGLTVFTLGKTGFIGTPATTSPSTSLADVTISLVPGQVQQINLAFKAKQDINNASFQISLPDNIDIQGHPGKQKLQWQASLKRGTNRLKLPLIARQQLTKNDRNRFVTARISYNGTSRDFKIRVKTLLQEGFINNNLKQAMTNVLFNNNKNGIFKVI